MWPATTSIATSCVARIDAQLRKPGRCCSVTSSTPRGPKSLPQQQSNHPELAREHHDGVAHESERARDGEAEIKRPVSRQSNRNEVLPDIEAPHGGIRAL